MRKLIKVLCGICTALSVIAFSLIYIGCRVIPDTVTIVDSVRYKTPTVFGIPVYNSTGANKASNKFLNGEKTKKETEIKLLNIIPVKTAEITNTKRKYVIPGGEVFGIKLYTDGVMIVGTDTIDGENGSENPAETAGLRVGDVIKKVNGKSVTSVKKLVSCISESRGKIIKFTVLRNNKTIDVEFKCVKEKNTGKYKAGLWVRDSTAGIGTVTFYNPENNAFGGLGHAICDIDTERIMPMSGGEMAETYVNGIYKSSKGSVGELCGVFTGKTTGKLCINDNTGIFGYIDKKTAKTDTLPVAVKQEIHEGKVKIICTLDKDGPKYYDAEIVKIYKNSQSINKDMVIEITDEELLRKTGGILQGMSGTPIIQDGMLIGAVTHVLVNNPKQGYAIFAERMTETAECREMKKFEELKKAS